MVPRRDRVPHVPVTPDQIVADGEACARAGATILHLHARGPDEEPDWRRDAYAETIAELRRRCPGTVLCVTTSGRVEPDLEKRADVLGLDGASKPDMASLTLGSLNFRDTASVNSPQTIEALATRMRDAGLRPELEIFDTGMAYLAHELVESGLLKPPLYANVLLGSVNTAPATAGSLAQLVDALPAGTVWAGAGLGAFQLPINAMALFMGGHVRTGLEDNPYFDYADRSPATNEQLVRRVAELARVAGRRLASTDEARELLGLTAHDTN
jgi:3-keto-5-aminohexanoate cleavage enzyme